MRWRPPGNRRLSRIEFAQVAPRSLDWGAFDCGDPRITAKLVREASRAVSGVQRLYGASDQDSLQAVLTLRAGQLQAPHEVLAALGVGSLEVPTLHIEVLAVRVGAQRRGYGEALLTRTVSLATQLQAQIGLLTVSLEATAESRPFYTRLGFACAASAWPDGSWPMWIAL
jgi:GNAT superfamily N-acetyltransferase